MKTECKPQKGRKPYLHFSDDEKIAIIKDYLSSGTTKRFIWKQYTGRAEEKGVILRWMREFGYDGADRNGRPNFKAMKKKVSIPEDNFEVEQLKARIAELQQQLEESQMKAIAFSTMVDIAEKEFNIPIRKKYNTKPSKK